MVRLVGLGQRPELGVVPLGRVDLHQHELALDQVLGLQLAHLHHRHELLDLPDHLLHRLRGEADHDGHAGVLGPLGGARP